MLAPTFNDLVEALIALNASPSSVDRNEVVSLLLAKLKEILERP